MRPGRRPFSSYKNYIRLGRRLSSPHDGLFLCHSMAVKICTTAQFLPLVLRLNQVELPAFSPFLPIIQQVKSLTYRPRRANIQTTEGPLLTPNHSTQGDEWGCAAPERR